MYAETDFVNKLKKDVPGVLTVTRELNEKKDPGRLLKTRVGY